MLASARFPSPAPPPQQRQSQSGLHELRRSEKPDALLHFLDELLDLEADYNATLTALLQNVSPVLDASNALSADKKQTLFSNLRELQAFSSRFLEDLSRTRFPERRGRIPRIIQDALERSAAAYDLYYRRYALTADVVCQLTSDQATSTLLKRLFSADIRIWPLNAAFGKPLQVFFNYKLLILKLMDSTGDTALSIQLGAIRDLLEKFLKMVYSARQAALDWEAMVTFEKQLDMSKLRDPKNPSIRLDTKPHCSSVFTSSWSADELARRRMVMVESFTEVCPLLSWRMGPRSQLAAMVRPRGRINLHLFTDILAVVRPMSRAEILKRVDNKTGYLIWAPIPLTDVEVGQYQYTADENLDLMIDGQLTLALRASSFAAKEKWLAEFRRLKEIMTDRAISEILTAMSAATLRNPVNQCLDGGERFEESEIPSRKTRYCKNVGSGGGSWVSGIKKAILKGGKDAKYKRDIFTAPSTTVESRRLFEHHVVSSPSLGSVFTNTAVKSTDLPAPPLSATFPLITRLFNAKGDGVQQPSARVHSPSMVVSMPVSLPGNHHQIPPPRSTSRATPLEPTIAAIRMSASNSIVGLVCRIEDCVVSVWREPVWQSLKDERCRVEVKRTAAGRAFLVAAIVTKQNAELQAMREVGAKDVSLSVYSWRTSRSNTSVVPTAHRPGRDSCAVDQDEDDENERQVLNAWIEPSTEAEMAEPTTVSVGFTLNGGRTARYMVGCGSAADARTLLESVRGQAVLAAIATDDAVEVSASPGQSSSQEDQRSATWLHSQGGSPSPQLAHHGHGQNVISPTSRIFCSTPTDAMQPTPLSPIEPHSPSSIMTTCSPPATPSSPARVRLLESRCKLYAVCPDPEYWSPLGRGRFTVSASQAGRDYHVTLVADSGPLLLDVPYRLALIEGRATSSSLAGTPATGACSVLRRLGNGRFTITARQAGRRVVYLIVYTETPDSYDVLWRKAVAA